MKLFLSCLLEEILGAQTLLSLRSQSCPLPPTQPRHERLATGTDDSGPLFDPDSILTSMPPAPCFSLSLTGPQPVILEAFLSAHWPVPSWKSGCPLGPCLSSFPPRAQFLILLLLPVSPPMSVPVVLPRQLLPMPKSHFSLS